MTDKIYKFDILYKLGSYEGTESISFDYLQACLKDVKDDRYESYDLYFEDYGRDFLEVFIRGIRWETDKELAARLLRESNQLKFKEEQERLEYERLKAKFKGEN